MLTTTIFKVEVDTEGRAIKINYFLKSLKASRKETIFQKGIQGHLQTQTLTDV